MWKLLDDITKEEHSQLRGQKRIKIYADENIEEELIEYLRGKGINITSAKELGHHGKPDEFHAALAFKKKRLLLTKNERDFFDAQKLPPQRLYGVISITGDMSNMEEYARTVQWIPWIVPYGDQYIGARIRLNPNEILFKFRDTASQNVTTRYKWEKRKLYIWIEETT